MQAAAQPPTVPPRSTMLVNLFLPLAPEWSIIVNGQQLLIEGFDLNSRLAGLHAGDLVIGIDPSGGAFWRCKCF